MNTIFSRLSSKLLLFSTSCLLFFALIAAAPSFLGQTLGARLSFIISHWDGMMQESDLSHDNISSWLPESGVRGRYTIAKSVLSKTTLEGIVGKPVFVSGPHEQGVDFTSKTSFGHYNPEFVIKLEGMLKVILSKQGFVRTAQPFYDTHLKNYLRTYYLAYKVGANNQAVMNSYMAAVEKADESNNNFLAEPSYILQESFREFSDELYNKEEGYDIYESFTCPGFWVRRSIDGTEDEFYDLLRYVMGIFDEGFAG